MNKKIKKCFVVGLTAVSSLGVVLGLTGCGEKQTTQARGESAYEIAARNGFAGTEAEWLASLKGEKGDDGDALDAMPDITIGTDGNWYINGVNTGLPSRGENGTNATQQGRDGKSVYELYQEATGDKITTITDWLAEYVYAKPGPQGVAGKSAYELYCEVYGTKPDLVDWLNEYVKGAPGAAGKSAYQIYKEAYPETELSETQWLISLKGEKGDTGAAGTNGKSAYEIAVEEGFNGTEAQWLASLNGEKGDDGTNGASAYEQWQALPGNSGKSFDDFLSYIWSTYDTDALLARIQQLELAVFKLQLQSGGAVTFPAGVAIPSGETLTVAGGTVLTIPSGVTLTIPTGVTIIVETGAAVTNEGTVIIEGTLTVGGAGTTFTNSGSVTVTGALTIDVTSGAVFTDNGGMVTGGENITVK